MARTPACAPAKHDSSPKEAGLCGIPITHARMTQGLHQMIQEAQEWNASPKQL